VASSSVPPVSRCEIGAGLGRDKHSELTDDRCRSDVLERDVAAELFISLSTVKSHISRVQEKLDVRNRVEIAAWSFEHRMLDST
jgi:hypothetical protein